MLIICAIPIIFYFCNFNDRLSTKNEDWGTFGDFIGGILNPMLSLANLIAVVWIAFLISKIDGKRETNSIIKLAQPFGIIETDDYENLSGVKITNGGLGPMIIKKIEINSSNDKIKIKSSNLIDYMPEIDGISWSDYVRNLENTAIPANNSESLIELSPDENKDIDEDIFKGFHDAIRATLADISIVVTYTDIYKSEEWPAEGALSQFKKNQNKLTKKLFNETGSKK